MTTQAEWLAYLDSALHAELESRLVTLLHQAVRDVRAATTPAEREAELRRMRELEAHLDEVRRTSP